MSDKKLVCIHDGTEPLLGVCSGLSEYFDIDVSIMRILWVLGFFMSGGLAVCVYIIVAMITPAEYRTEIDTDGTSSETKSK